jgi:hypothetical protein
LKQEHEEGHRLLHYLRQANTSLATCTFLCGRIQETGGKWMKSVQSWTFRVSNDVWNLSVSNCVSCPWLLLIMGFFVLFTFIYLSLVRVLARIKNL